jgi:ABC-type nitrate/sulfonate/bicarbonate transport system ATPase subunit
MARPQRVGGEPHVASLRDVEVVFAQPKSDTGPVRPALQDITLDVHRGELLVLVGRSGCGKTTVLNLLVGLVEATRGRVELFGTSPKDARSRVGYMFARDALLPWRTAAGNVEFALELRRPELSRAERRERAAEMLERLGIGYASRRYPWQLSQGMRQRVAVARTWVVEPDVLLMDEPFAALDAQTRTDTQAEFSEIWARDRKSAVFVTHDLQEAIVLADRIVVMDAGRVIDEIRVKMPKPRDPHTIVLEDEYRDIHRRLLEALGEGPPATAVNHDNEVPSEGARA